MSHTTPASTRAIRTHTPPTFRLHLSTSIWHSRHTRRRRVHRDCRLATIRRTLTHPTSPAFWLRLDRSRLPRSLEGSQRRGGMVSPWDRLQSLGPQPDRPTPHHLVLLSQRYSALPLPGHMPHLPPFLSARSHGHAYDGAGLFSRRIMHHIDTRHALITTTIIRVLNSSPHTREDVGMPASRGRAGYPGDLGSDLVERHG